METVPSNFKTRQGYSAYRQAYQSALELWPIQPESIHIPTRLGSTHALVCGDPAAPALLLLHGAGNSATMWYPVIAQLSAHFRTYALDTIGDGGFSALDAKVRRRAEYAGWLEDVLDGLKISQTNVVGLSYGGWLSLNLALNAPQRVRRMALLAPAASLQRFSLPVGFFLRAADYLPFTPDAESTVRWMTAKGTFVDPRYTGILTAATRHGKLEMLFPDVYSDAELRQIRTPTLLVYGDQEVIYNTHKAAERARRLLPNVQVVFLPDAGHFMTMDQPELLGTTLVNFLTA